MYGLRADVDLTFLRDRKLTQIRVGEFQAQLCFEDDIVISAEGRVSINGHPYDDFRSMSAPLASLLGTTVIDASSAGTGDLVLKTSDGSVVVVHDSRGNYESYTVTWPGGTLVV